MSQSRRCALTTLRDSLCQTAQASLDRTSPGSARLYSRQTSAQSRARIELAYTLSRRYHARKLTSALYQGTKGGNWARITLIRLGRAAEIEGGIFGLVAGGGGLLALRRMFAAGLESFDIHIVDSRAPTP